MLCSNCAKLAMLATKRRCHKCGLWILNNLYVICEECSEKEQVCAICLKKISGSVTNQFKNRGCGRCGN